MMVKRGTLPNKDIAVEETGLGIESGKLSLDDLKKDKGSLTLLVNEYNKISKKFATYERYNEERIILKAENIYLKKTKKITIGLLVSIGIVSSILTSVLNNLSLSVPLAVVLIILILLFYFVEWKNGREKDG